MFPSIKLFNRLCIHLISIIIKSIQDYKMNNYLMLLFAFLLGIAACKMMNNKSSCCSSGKRIASGCKNCKGCQGA